MRLTYAKIKLTHFLNVLALPSVICWPIPLFNASCGFQKNQNRFNKKNLYSEKSGGKKCLLWTYLTPL